MSASAVSHYRFLTKEAAGYKVKTLVTRERVTMDSNLRRNSGRFAGFAVRTIPGFSMLNGCITTAAARENAGLQQLNNTTRTVISLASSKEAK